MKKASGGGTLSSFIKFSGFTLAEMMVVLLIMTIILAAMAPVMTTRMSANKAVGGNSKSEIWKYVEDSGETDIYYGTTNNQRAMIGQNKAETAESARLILNTSDDIPNHLMFRNDKTTLGALTFGTDNSLLLGSYPADTTLGAGAVSIGKASVADKDGSIAIGINDSTKGALGTKYDIAIGYKALAKGYKNPYYKDTYYSAVALGYNSQADCSDYGNCLAIGNEAKSPHYSLAIGASALSGTYSIAIGNYAEAYSNATVIGHNASATAPGAVVIGGYNAGPMASAKGTNSVAINGSASGYSVSIGYASQASNGMSVALGHRANASGNVSIAIGAEPSSGGIGHDAPNATANYSIAIGAGTKASNEHSIAIGGYTGGIPTAYTKASGEASMAFGRGAVSSGNYSIAIGSFDKEQYVNWREPTTASGEYSIAMGTFSEATASNSVAIGHKAKATTANTIVLGTATETVQIPGSLTVATTSYPSDKKLKNIGKEYTSSLDKIKQLKPFNFTYKDDKNKTPRVGVIAQDLQKVFPNAVSKGKDGFLTIRMEDMFYAVINAIKELDAKITQMMKQESEKDKKIKDLEKRIEFLEQKLIQSP